MGDQKGFQRTKGSNKRDPNEGSDVSIALKKRKKRKDRNDELFTSFKNVDASVELGIGSNKSASEKKSGNRDYPQEINNRTSTIFILCKTFQQSFIIHIDFVQDFTTTYDGTEVTALWKASYFQEKPYKKVEANCFSIPWL